jgi:hypothetical protein
VDHITRRLVTIAKAIRPITYKKTPGTFGAFLLKTGTVSLKLFETHDVTNEVSPLFFAPALSCLKIQLTNSGKIV